MNGSRVGVLRQIVENNKDKVFLIDSIKGNEYTYGDIEDLASRLALIFKEEGLEKGDKVAIILPNCIEFIIIYFACMQLGAVPVPINIKSTPREIAFLLDHSEARMLFVSSLKRQDMVEKIHLLQNEKKLLKTVFLGEVDLLGEIKRRKRLSDTPFGNIHDDDTFLMMYTSGTTKQPKGVMISYGALIGNGLAFIRFQNLERGLRFYGILSLSYTAGFYNLIMVPFLLEGSVVIDEEFGPMSLLTFWKKISKHEVSGLWLVPSILSIMLALDKSELGKKYCNERNIKVAFVGTAPLHESLRKNFEERYSLSLYQSYGLSELLFVSTNSPSFPCNRGVGRILPGINVNIIREEAGAAQPCSSDTFDRSGELLITTEYLMQGYYKNAEEEKKLMVGGSFFTGDVGFIDEEGYLFITDRKKDLIIKGGINISPKEIEDAVMKLDKVEEVAVIGIPDEKSGEEVVLLVRAAEGLSGEEIRNYCKENIAPFKAPKYIHFVDKFPKSVTGKIQKNKLRELVISAKIQ